MAMTHRSFVTVVQRECFSPISFLWGLHTKQEKRRGWKDDWVLGGIKQELGDMDDWREKGRRLEWGQGEMKKEMKGREQEDKGCRAPKQRPAQHCHSCPNGWWKHAWWAILCSKDYVQQSYNTQKRANPNPHLEETHRHTTPKFTFIDVQSAKFFSQNNNIISLFWPEAAMSLSHPWWLFGAFLLNIHHMLDIHKWNIKNWSELLFIDSKEKSANPDRKKTSFTKSWKTGL